MSTHAYDERKKDIKKKHRRNSGEDNIFLQDIVSSGYILKSAIWGQSWIIINPDGDVVWNINSFNPYKIVGGEKIVRFTRSKFWKSKYYSYITIMEVFLIISNDGSAIRIKDRTIKDYESNVILEFEDNNDDIERFLFSFRDIQKSLGF